MSDERPPVQRATPYAALSLTILLWAGAFVWIRVALEDYSVAHLTFLRLAIAAIALGALLTVRGQTKLPAARDVPAIVFLGLAGMALYQLLLNAGERTIPAATASMLVNLSPIFTALAARVLLDERLARHAWLGIAIAFAGASAIALEGGGGLELRHGALLVLGAALAQAAYFVAQKPLLRRYGSLELTAWAMIAAALMTLPLAPGVGSALSDASAAATLAVVLLGIGSSAIGFVSFAYAVSRIDVSHAASTLYAVPVVTIAVAWLWLSELPGAVAVLGGAVALAGVAMTNAGRRSRKPGPAATL
ncbi:MAG: DMT family transporter [Actinobacteria bacterium]|nr:DMT family transporter [Actinomycetota bacterium]